MAVNETVLLDAGGGEFDGGLLKLAVGGALGAELGGGVVGTWAGLLIGVAVVGGCELGGAAAAGGIAEGGAVVGVAVGGAEMLPVPLSRLTLVGNGEIAGRNGCDSLRGGGAWATTVDTRKLITSAAPNAASECLMK